MAQTKADPFNIARDELLNLIRSREQTTRENTTISQNPREVYKEEKKEIQKESSRLHCEDVMGVEVSTRPASWPEAVASSSAASTPSSFPLTGTSCQERVVIDNGPRELASRYSGITVQHVRTAKGVKVAITLQQPEWAAEGACQMATAELKRYDRMREIKPTAEDSPEFVRYLDDAKSQLQATRNRSACIGRLHHRGRRSQWLLDTLIVAIFEDDRMTNVMLYLEGEEFVIEMTHDMSPKQQEYYHCAGVYGEIQSGRQAPRLSDLPLVKFGD
jgi:hypothetical protein